MGKIFLSHSSKDKDRIGQIANALGPDVVIYDELSFDDGQAIVDEIENGLDNSDMFVLFISDASLNSTWVNRELAVAQTRFRDNVLRFLPIIIDQKVNYTDPRIPDWVRETYILRYNGSLKKIIRLIKQKRIERSWQLFPHLRQKDRLFVGRNAIIDNIESKLYHVTDKRPNTIIASGIKRIGRKSTVIHTLRKNGYIGETYSPNIITLDRHSNIDNLLLALSDIGICENIITPKDLLCSIPEKIQTTATLLSLIAEAKEIIVIEDSGCIISPENEIADWFVKLSELTHPINQILNIITTPYRLHQTSINHLPILYFHIPELEREERRRLLMKYLNIEAIDLTADDIDFLAGLQKGFPEQAIYTVDLLKDIGISSLKRESFRVIEFNQDRVSTLLKEFLESEMQFLSFMARFDFISIELLNEMISEENTYTSCINKWIAHSLCEQIGTNLEYIRVNDAIKDYILRLKIDVPPVLAEKLRSVAKDYLSRGDFSDRSEYIISLRELLTENPNLNDDRIIPSIYLKTMVDLYNNHKNRYNDVINLADRVLSREEFLDRRFAQEVRYRLCQSLARTRNGRFMEEVHKINGIEHHYLLGFHYRISGRNEDALNRLNKVLQSKPNHSRAKRELVHVYLNIEEYDQALDMASDNYRSEPSNPYLIQSYFTCLIRSQDSTAHREKIEELIQRLQRIRTSAAEEIYINSLAQYQAFTLGDKASAIKCIEDYQETTAEASPYIALTKIEIGIRYKDIGLMRQSLELLGTMNIQNSYLNNLYFLKLATLNAMEGNRPEAERNIQKIVNYPPNIRAKLMSKIESFLPKN